MRGNYYRLHGRGNTSPAQCDTFGNHADLSTELSGMMNQPVSARSERKASYTQRRRGDPEGKPADDRELSGGISSIEVTGAVCFSEPCPACAVQRIGKGHSALHERQNVVGSPIEDSPHRSRCRCTEQIA